MGSYSLKPDATAGQERSGAEPVAKVGRVCVSNTLSHVISAHEIGEDGALTRMPCPAGDRKTDFCPEATVITPDGRFLCACNYFTRLNRRSSCGGEAEIGDVHRSVMGCSGSPDSLCAWNFA